jgi:hypothetical protein
VPIPVRVDTDDVIRLVCEHVSTSTLLGAIGAGLGQRNRGGWTVTGHAQGRTGF